MKIPPSVFAEHAPMGSLVQNCECEVVAQNIMMIRKRLGDRWELTWAEYKRERTQDGEFSMIEKPVFERVMPLISDPINAAAFAPSWTRAASKWSRDTKAAVNEAANAEFIEFSRAGLQLSEVCEIARRALADGDFFDETAVEMDLSDAALKAIQERLEKFTGVTT